jgi:hypothetical protein
VFSGSGGLAALPRRSRGLREPQRRSGHINGAIGLAASNLHRKFLPSAPAGAPSPACHRLGRGVDNAVETMTASLMRSTPRPSAGFWRSTAGSRRLSRLLPWFVPVRWCYVLGRRAAKVCPVRRPRQRAGVTVSRPRLATVSVWPAGPAARLAWLRVSPGTCDRSRRRGPHPPRLSAAYISADLSPTESPPATSWRSPRSSTGYPNGTNSPRPADHLLDRQVSGWLAVAELRRGGLETRRL